MCARLGLWKCAVLTLGFAVPACARGNPAFDGPSESVGDGGDDTSNSGDPQTSGIPVDTGEDDPAVCAVSGGVDMSITVPQPCGETNDQLDTYEHWFKVVEAAGSTWQVQFCMPDCVECEPLAAGLQFSPLPVAELAGPDTCLRLAARRLGTGDDCDYQTAVVQDMTNNGNVLILARRTELLTIPDLPTNTGLFGFEPALVVDETCDCDDTPDACCDGQAATLYAYEVAGQEIRVGETKDVTLGGRSYEFWAFDAFQPGDCGAGLQIAWALTAGEAN